MGGDVAFGTSRLTRRSLLLGSAAMTLLGSDSSRPREMTSVVLAEDGAAPWSVDCRAKSIGARKRRGFRRWRRISSGCLERSSRSPREMERSVSPLAR